MEDLFEALFEIIGEIAPLLFPWGFVWFSLSAIIPGICYLYFVEVMTTWLWVINSVASFFIASIITVKLHDWCN